jgi:hypothetical protein
MRRAALALVLLASCASDDPVTGPADAPLAQQNPRMLWLAGVNGSESHLELVETGPPSPF